jgi:glycosyltransferase involved in cell wall biosynthesis
LGGFDEILRPFYYEDTDLGLMAWKRGWKVLYQPRSIVFHEHRGTIGRKFAPAYISSVLKKNSILFVWKNIHSWNRLATHFAFVFFSALRTFLFGDAPGAFSFPGLAKAVLQLPALAKSRWRARRLSAIDDTEAFRRPLGAYYRDRFEAAHESVPDRLRVLFAAPYAIEPPVHGGAVFMKLTLEELSPLADVHLAGMVDVPSQLPAQHSLRKFCQSVAVMERNPRTPRNMATLLPHAVREFADADFAWILHRIAFTKKIDVIQLEYTQFAQYAGQYRHIPCFLFEHDIHFQSVQRLAKQQAQGGRKLLYTYEYLRALRYELRALQRMTRIQACSEENATTLTEFMPALKQKIDSNLRAGIQTKRFRFGSEGREPDTMLFVGSFRHEPNNEALRWFVSEILPQITAANSRARLIIVGSDPPPSMAFLTAHSHVSLTGYVEDIRNPLTRYAVFVCPILSGSGIRVKLLEAFASGIPCVSTPLGAEGLAQKSGEVCELASTAQAFAQAVLKLLGDREHAAALAYRARHMMEAERDGEVITNRLEHVYRTEVSSLRRSPIAAATVERMPSPQASGSASQD